MDNDSPGLFQITQHAGRWLLAANYTGGLYSTTAFTEDTIWMIEAIGGGQHRVMHRLSGRVLDGVVPGSAGTHPWNKADSQWWSIPSVSATSVALLQQSSHFVLQANPDNNAVSTGAFSTSNDYQLWDLARVSDLQLQWIESTSLATAVTALGPGTPVTLAPTADARSQLWVVGGNALPILNLDSGLLLDVSAENAVCVNPAAQGKSSQLWTLSPSGELSINNGQLLATASTDGKTVLAQPQAAVSGDDKSGNQAWNLRVYTSEPDAAHDTFPGLSQSATFMLVSASDAISAIAATDGPGSPLTLRAGAIVPAAVWNWPNYGGFPGSLLNSATPLVICVRDDGMLVGSVLDVDYHPWALTPQGQLVDLSSGLVATMDPDGIRAMPFDPLCPLSQLWVLVLT